MKNYLFTRNYIKQIFADDPAQEQQSTEQSTESQEGKTKEADPPKPDDKGGEKKYTDADIDKIVNTRLAREREKHQKDVDEAKKLGEMGAQERAEYERDQLKKELDALKKETARNGMAKEARKMLAAEDITIPDTLVSMLITTEAESTKQNVNDFAKIFKEAVQDAVKDALKGKAPSMGGKSTITKAELDKKLKTIASPYERQRLIAEHIDLYQKGNSMNRIRKYAKQIFAAEANTTTSADLEPVISIDHTNRLVEGIKSLQTVLGIVDLKPMAEGTTVKMYKTTQKNTPDQVAEGETILLTKLDRKLVKTFELKLNKYRKQTTAEAIQKVGKQKAINETDTVFMRNIQKGIKNTFFVFVAAGTGTAENLAEKKAKASASIQGALAGLWAKLSAYFEDMDVEPIYFINPLDIATYLANAQITIQTAFGFQYVENFLGLGTVVLDNSLPAGSVEGTVKQNLNGVFIPADGSVGETFGLTTDETGMVGMKHYLADDSASVNTLIMEGVTFYAEDASGIFKAPIAVEAATEPASLSTEEATVATEAKK